MILLANQQTNLNVRMFNYNKSIRNKEDNSYGKNCKEKNYNRLNNHLVVIRIFNFLGGRLEFK
jgi:hypothetical protein